MPQLQLQLQLHSVLSIETGNVANHAALPPPVTLLIVDFAYHTKLLLTLFTPQFTMVFANFSAIVLRVE